MTRPRTAAALTAVALTLLAAGPSTAPSAGVTKAAMQGSWTATHISGGPTAKHDSPPAGITLKVDGDHMTLGDHGNDERAVVTLDAAHTPIWFELKSDAGQQFVSGILDVSGDQLRMAFRKQGDGDRPTGFDPVDGVTVMTFKRAAATTRP